MCDAVFFRVLFLEARFNDVIGFKSRNHNIEDPKENKDTSGDSYDALGSTKFTTNSWVSSQQKDGNSEQSFCYKDCHRETQAADRDLEVQP